MAEMTAEMTGGQAVVRQLRREGVEAVFGLPGDQTMHALDAFYDEPAIRFVTTRHEQGTTYMADGYARAGGRPGTAFVVPGVGVYNAAAGLATAYACSSPVFLLAGQVNREGIGRGLGLLHDVHDQLEIVRPITKHAERVLDPVRIPGAIHDAFVAMATGRPRPVEVEIPPETLADVAPIELLDAEVVAPTGGDPELVRSAAEMLLGARSPLVVAGGGVNLGAASAELTAVAELVQAPVVTTREGKGAIDDRHPLAAGTMWNNRRLRPVLDAADVILAVGTRLQGFGLAPRQQVVHVDVDPTEIGKQGPVALGITGDAGATLRQLLEELDRAASPRPSRAAEVRAMRAAVEEELRAIGPQARMVDALREGIPDDAIVAAGTTSVAYLCHMLFPVYEPRTYLSTSYMGTLGAAFPIALGAKVARPDRPVVAIKGDGGFLFAATELATASQHGIETVTVVFDDGAYGNSNRDQRERFRGREIGTTLENPDFAALARSFGVDGMQLRGVEELAPALKEAFANGRSTVVVCPMDRLPSPF